MNKSNDKLHTAVKAFMQNAIKNEVSRDPECHYIWSYQPQRPLKKLDMGKMVNQK